MCDFFLPPLNKYTPIYCKEYSLFIGGGVGCFSSLKDRSESAFVENITILGLHPSMDVNHVIYNILTLPCFCLVLYCIVCKRIKQEAGCRVPLLTI